MTTTLIIVRHGETAWNKDVRFRGLTELPLNEAGLKQAELTAQRIVREYQPAAIYASPLQRAMQTGEALARLTRQNVTPHQALIDIDFGDFSGLTFPEAEERFPEIYHDFFHAPERVRFPHGESLADVSSRVMTLVPELTAAYPNGQVALVTHQVVGKVLMCALLGVGNERFWQFRLDNASFSVFEIANGLATLVSANETCHLKWQFGA